MESPRYPQERRGSQDREISQRGCDTPLEDYENCVTRRNLGKLVSMAPCTMWRRRDQVTHILIRHLDFPFVWLPISNLEVRIFGWPESVERFDHQKHHMTFQVHFLYWPNISRPELPTNPMIDISSTVNICLRNFILHDRLRGAFSSPRLQDVRISFQLFRHRSTLTIRVPHVYIYAHSCT